MGADQGTVASIAACWHRCSYQYVQKAPAIALPTLATLFLNPLTPSSGGYIISAIFICWEYQRLGMHHRQHRILRISFWIKLAFIFVEFGLAIAFGVLGARQGHYRISAILEWVIALIYAVFVWSFAIDFIPAVRTHHFKSSETTVEVESAMEEESRGRGYQGGLDEEQAAYRSAGYANGHGQTNGHASVKPEGMQPSRNF